MGNENGFENVCSYTPIEMKCTLCCGIYCDYKDTLNEIISIDYAICILSVSYANYLV